MFKFWCTINYVSSFFDSDIPDKDKVEQLSYRLSLPSQQLVTALRCGLLKTNNNREALSIQYPLSTFLSGRWKSDNCGVVIDRIFFWKNITPSFLPFFRALGQCGPTLSIGVKLVFLLSLPRCCRIFSGTQIEIIITLSLICLKVIC